MVHRPPDGILDLQKRLGQPNGLGARVGQVDRDDLLDAARACSHHHHPVGQVHGFFHVMGDEHHRSFVLGPGVQQLVLHLHPRQRIQCTKGLIHQQDLRVHRVGAGNGATLLHATRERLGQGMGKLPQPHQVQALAYDGVALAFGRVLDRQAELDVLADRQPREQGVLLEDDAAFGARPGNGPAVQAHLAGAGLQQAGCQVHQRRFAAARRADQGHKFAVGNAERDLVNRQKRLSSQLEAAGDSVKHNLVWAWQTAHRRSCQPVRWASSRNRMRSITRPVRPIVISATKMVSRS